LRSVLLPPSENGMMWSYSNFSLEAHSTRLPPSRCHTYILTLLGIDSRRRLCTVGVWRSGVGKKSPPPSFQRWCAPLREREPQHDQPYYDDA
jgi:hypothetical protein